MEWLLIQGFLIVTLDYIWLGLQMYTMIEMIGKMGDRGEGEKR